MQLGRTLFMFSWCSSDTVPDKPPRKNETATPGRRHRAQPTTLTRLPLLPPFQLPSISLSLSQRRTIPTKATQGTIEPHNPESDFRFTQACAAWPALEPRIHPTRSCWQGVSFVHRDARRARRNQRNMPWNLVEEAVLTGRVLAMRPSFCPAGCQGWKVWGW